MVEHDTEKPSCTGIWWWIDGLWDLNGIVLSQFRQAVEWESVGQWNDDEPNS